MQHLTGGVNFSIEYTADEKIKNKIQQEFYISPRYAIEISADRATKNMVRDPLEKNFYMEIEEGLNEIIKGES